MAEACNTPATAKTAATAARPNILRTAFMMNSPDRHAWAARASRDSPGTSITEDDAGLLPDHPRTKSGLSPGRLDFLLQETMRFAADITGPRIGPGAALVFGGAGRLSLIHISEPTRRT